MMQAATILRTDGCFCFRSECIAHIGLGCHLARSAHFRRLTTYDATPCDG